MHTFTGEWDCVRFIVYLVYLSMHSRTRQWDIVWFIGLFGLLVYFTMHTFTGEWDFVRFIRRDVRHHRKHMLDDPPNMIDPINYVLLFCSIPLFKSFHVACRDNYVLKGDCFYLFKVFIGPKLRQVSIGNFHRKVRERMEK